MQICDQNLILNRDVIYKRQTLTSASNWEHIEPDRSVYPPL